MAANLKPYQPKGKRNTTKTEKPITPAEAGEILLSALNYCQKANLLVHGYNDGEILVLAIVGLSYADGRITPANVTPKEMQQVTP